jgi:hypothetical protein
MAKSPPRANEFQPSMLTHEAGCEHAWHRKEPEMMLKDKVAVIYGAGGAIGGVVARAFGREGAKLFLTGRRSKLSLRPSFPPADPQRQLRSMLSSSRLWTSISSL